MPKKAPNARTVFGSILMVFVPSASKYRTSPALDISPPEFCPLLIPVGGRFTVLNLSGQNRRVRRVKKPLSDGRSNPSIKR